MNAASYARVSLPPASPFPSPQLRVRDRGSTRSLHCTHSPERTRPSPTLNPSPAPAPTPTPAPAACPSPTALAPATLPRPLRQAIAATPKPASRAQVEKQMRELLLADLPGQAFSTPMMYQAATRLQPCASRPTPQEPHASRPHAYVPRQQAATPRTQAATPRMQAPIDLGPGHRQPGQLVPHPPTSAAARSSSGGPERPKVRVH